MRFNSVVSQTPLHGRLGENIRIISGVKLIICNMLYYDRSLLIVNERGRLDYELLRIIGKLPENGRMNPFEYPYNGGAGKTRFCNNPADKIIPYGLPCIPPARRTDRTD